MTSSEESWSERICTFLHGAMDFVWYCLRLSVVFLLFSLPVITVFAALGAAVSCIAETQRSGYAPVFDRFLQYFKANALRSSVLGAGCTITGIALAVSGTYYYYLTAGSAVQYLAVIIFAMMAFFDFSFLICYFCVNALVDLPLGVMLANIARYALLTIPANLGLLLAAVLMCVLLCIKPFLLTLLPLLLCLYGWLCVLSHKDKILFYMTSNE